MYIYLQSDFPIYIPTSLCEVLIAPCPETTLKGAARLRLGQPDHCEVVISCCLDVYFP